ncbi:polyribonucleotide nucleotidyltransferase, partial [Patescibacteria group bacterium]|nr:polyribonucleotide nucleotidyltransferase [Patescibacteria group bacterium]
MEKKTFSCQFSGRTLEVQLGVLAQQANGSVLLSYGGSTVLATAVMSRKQKDCDYLPLTLEYEEKLYAAGKIKGSRFIKREGRPQDEAIVSGRLIDRTLRPRFDHRIRNEIQVVITVLSFDKENDPDVLGILAASLALSISDIPWSGPVAGVRVGRSGEEFLINPTYAQREKSDLDLIVSGTAQKINMLEAGAKEITEPVMVAAIEAGEKAYQELIDFQNKIIQEIQPKKMALTLCEPDETLKQKVKEFLAGKLPGAIYVKEKMSHATKIEELSQALVDFIKSSETENVDGKITGALMVFEEEINDLVHKNIIEKEKRPDGRALNEIREISCQVGVLARTHGSSIFNRGTTQALSVVTLGAPSEKQIIDGLEQEYKKRFLHHYNFPPYSVGEVGGFRGPGRREIGHGALAERSIWVMIPPEEEFPYTIRVVSEILSSNGSSSMASACASSLALMDAGVPIKEAVAGIALGLMSGDKGNYKILTDIQGPEDHHGDMDLKAAGTKNGICGLQMDVKIEGVTVKILDEALQRAKEARLQILEKMNAALPNPRPSLSEFAPRIITLQINPEKIREVVGPGGKVINEIINQTGVKIDIEDSGMIFITSENSQAAQKALAWIKNITHEVKPGEIFNGRVTRLMNFGA